MCYGLSEQFEEGSGGLFFGICHVVGAYHTWELCKLLSVLRIFLSA